jgi:hypothetical protein
MQVDRPWYREPETFIAVAALVVSVSAVVVGLYEAALQRAHDRAEVWPHVEISTFVTPKGASLFVANTGLGPAIIKSVVVTVDGKPRRNWEEVLRALGDSGRAALNTTTVVDHALRGGERTPLVELDRQAVPPHFWEWVARVTVTICYSSVFNESWVVSDEHLGSTSTWRSVAVCPGQASGVDL